jgi:glycosyltransferase involved in cell wall biosynthesis
VGALPEVVYEGINGFLYPPGDEAALSAIIAQIAQHPRQLDNLQTPGPLELLSIPAVVDRLENSYRNSCEIVRYL